MMVKKSANPSGSTKEGLEVELSGLFGTLGNAVDLLGKLTDAGVKHLQHQDELTLKGLGVGRAASMDSASAPAAAARAPTASSGSATSMPPRRESSSKTCTSRLSTCSTRAAKSWSPWSCRALARTRSKSSSAMPSWPSSRKASAATPRRFCCRVPSTATACRRNTTTACWKSVHARSERVAPRVSDESYWTERWTIPLRGHLLYRAARIHGARHRRARRRRAHRQLPAARGGRQQLSQRRVREQPAKHDGAHTRARRGHGAVRPAAGALRHDCAGRGLGRGAAPRTTLPGVHRTARADARPDRGGAQGVLVRGRRGGRSGAGERDDSPDARRPQRTFADGNVL